MPPGGRGIPEKRGTRDYCWLIWTRWLLVVRRICGLNQDGWWRAPHGSVLDWLQPLNGSK
jgi:hypothetical protein